MSMRNGALFRSPTRGITTNPKIGTPVHIVSVIRLLMPSQLSPEVYKRRRRQFQNDLVGQLSFLGYTVIILHYLKAGSSTLTLIARLCIQSLLTSPYPSELQLRRLSLTAQSRTIPGFRRREGAEPAPLGTAQIPGAVSNMSGNPPDAASEHAVEEVSDRLRHNIRWVLFHSSLTFNFFCILLSVIWPINFQEKLGRFKLPEKNLGNIPSPFNNYNGLMGGELRGTLFIQFIGERVPASNFWGNLVIVFLGILILVCQFGLYLLTCYNFAKPPINEFSGEDADDVLEENDLKDGGYGGNVLVTTVDPVRVFTHVFQERYGQIPSNPSGGDIV